jgi:IS30 family transposase
MLDRGFTLEQIAGPLNSSKSTIARDLEEFSHHGKTQPRVSKRGRKGEGRPKGRVTKSPAVKDKHEKIVALRDSGMSSKDVSAEVGVSSRINSNRLLTQNCDLSSFFASCSCVQPERQNSTASSLWEIPQGHAWSK